MRVYKILRAPEWQQLRAVGETSGAPVDLACGFVHLSTGEQVVETAARHFAGEADLFVLALEADQLGEALRWEPSRGGALFPHLYGRLRLANVLWARPLPFDGQRHDFGALE